MNDGYICFDNSGYDFLANVNPPTTKNSGKSNPNPTIFVLFILLLFLFLLRLKNNKW
jgi:hypothetical protein